jgi:hypothetical protein
MLKRILCTGAGGPAGINFTMSLRAAPEEIFLVGTDSNEYFVNLAITDQNFLVPRAKDPEYIGKLNEIIRKEKIEFLHAQPDVEVEVVSENREKLDAPVYLPSKAAGAGKAWRGGQGKHAC